MKIIVLAAALLTLLAAFTAVAQHGPDARPIDFKVKGVGYDTTYATVSGVSVGATESQLTAKFGKPRLRSDLGYEVMIEYDTKPDYIGLSFHFKDKKLFKIVMAEAIC